MCHATPQAKKGGEKDFVNDDSMTFVPKRVAVVTSRRLLMQTGYLKQLEDDIGNLPTYNDFLVRVCFRCCSRT